jgi:hypothetical protein
MICIINSKDPMMIHIVLIELTILICCFIAEAAAMLFFLLL